MKFGELFKPQEGQAVRFCTTQSLGSDLQQHGISGFFRDDRFWSADMADHWAPREITNWAALAAKLQLGVNDRFATAPVQRETLAETGNFATTPAGVAIPLKGGE